MGKSDRDSDRESQPNGPLHSKDDEEDDRDSSGALLGDSVYGQSSLNENDDNPHRNEGKGKSTKRRSEELAKWELANKREASRLSSMRCQQRKRKRMKYLKDEEDRLRALNQNISQQNDFLRKLITTIRETLNSMPPNGMQNNPLAMAQPLVNQGNIGLQPQFVGVPQMAVSQTLNLSLALTAAMNQQIQGQTKPTLQSQALINPLMNPQLVQQPTFGLAQPSINPSGSINPTMPLDRLQNNLPVHNALPIVQNLVTVSQPQEANQIPLANPQQLQEQLLSQQGSHLNQQIPGSGPHDRERKSNK